jgi:hypothetical protein
MYLILFSLTMLLGLVDLWTIGASMGWLVG